MSVIYPPSYVVQIDLLLKLYLRELLTADEFKAALGLVVDSMECMGRVEQYKRSVAAR